MHVSLRTTGLCKLRLTISQFAVADYATLTNDSGQDNSALQFAELVFGSSTGMKVAITLSAFSDQIFATYTTAKGSPTSQIPHSQTNSTHSQTSNSLAAHNPLLPILRPPRPLFRQPRGRTLPPLALHHPPHRLLQPAVRRPRLLRRPLLLRLSDYVAFVPPSVLPLPTQHNTSTPPWLPKRPNQNQN
jgi:hypothetical protein